MEEAIHLPCEPDPDMAEVVGGEGKVWNLSVGAQGRKGQGRKKVWGKEMGPHLLIKAVNIERPPRALKLTYYQGVVLKARLDYPNPY